MSDKQTFLHAIKEAPENDTTRLVFADYLEEQGDPAAPYLRAWVQLANIIRYPDDLAARRAYADLLATLEPVQKEAFADYEELFPGIAGIAYHPKERAEFIRLHIAAGDIRNGRDGHIYSNELAQFGELNHKAEALLYKYGNAWLELAGAHTYPLTLHVAGLDTEIHYQQSYFWFRDGFVDSICCGRQMLDKLSKTEIMEPLATLSLNVNRTEPDQPQPDIYSRTTDMLRRAPWLGRLKTLDAFHMSLDTWELAELFAHGSLDDIVSLYLATPQEQHLAALAVLDDVRPYPRSPGPFINGRSAEQTVEESGMNFDLEEVLRRSRDHVAQLTIVDYKEMRPRVLRRMG